MKIFEANKRLKYRFLLLTSNVMVWEYMLDILTKEFLKRRESL